MSTKLRSAKWIQKNGFAPQVFLFRNIETNQVLYSQLPHISDYQIKQQFWRPNWQDRKPQKRRDIWRCMAVADFHNYDNALKAYHALVELRYLRQVTKKEEAMAMRRRNKDGNIWYSAQFRPVHSQEAVADLSTVIDEFNMPSKIYWESLWRRGDEKYWNKDLTTHEEMDLRDPRFRTVVLNDIKEKSKAEIGLNQARAATSKLQ
ncbi:hypothetical protein LJB42_002862 [Komagataella kurtzmanii]|nr:hypothetical protein LJB42_002862 [Komagataella kurtzmanii]